MLLTRNLVWTAALLVATMPAALAQSLALDKILGNGGRPVSGQELTDILSGQTQYGRFLQGRGSWIEYYAPDGRLAFDNGRDVSFGAWRVAKNEACFRYLGDADRNVQCYRYFLLGDFAYGVRTNDAGESHVSYRVDAIVAGDPEGLSEPR